MNNYILAATTETGDEYIISFDEWVVARRDDLPDTCGAWGGAVNAFMEEDLENFCVIFDRATLYLMEAPDLENLPTFTKENSLASRDFLKVEI